MDHKELLRLGYRYCSYDNLIAKYWELLSSYSSEKAIMTAEYTVNHRENYVAMDKADGRYFMGFPAKMSL